MAKKKRKARPKRIKKVNQSTRKTNPFKNKESLFEGWRRELMPQWLREITTELDQAHVERAKELLSEEALEKHLAMLTEPMDIYFSNCQLGLLLIRTYQGERALKHCFDALKLSESVLVYNLIAFIYEKMGKCDLVLEYLEKAKKIDPNNIVVYNNLASSLMKLGRTEEAIGLFKKAIAANPQYRDPYTNLLLNLHYLPELDVSGIYEETKRWASVQAPLHLAYTHHDNIPDPNRKLRIGYISPDFRNHSVMYFFESLLRGHDRNHFELYGYGSVIDPDKKTTQTIPRFDSYRNIKGVKDKDAAEVIKFDKIDILVDLAGHTAASRLGVLAYKPAPIQVTYLGYPNTTGMSQVDYRLTDAIADTPDQQQYYTEELVFLPNGFLCYDPGEIQPPIKKLPSLSKDYFLFGCFNNPKKINAPTAKMWVDLLEQVPNSKLLLKFKEGGDEAIKEYLWNLFAEQGLKEPKKTVMIFGTIPYDAHLDLYNSIDIALDTYPYNGTTTTCQALLMGVPVITLTGKHHASRVGLDILSRVDMQFFSAQTPEEYVKKATVLASKPDSLAMIRETMRHRLAASPLCNYEIITNDIENAYRKMWHTWCEAQDRNFEIAAGSNTSDQDPETVSTEPETYTIDIGPEMWQPKSQLETCSANEEKAAELETVSTAAAVKTKPRKLHIGGKVSHPEWELLNIQAGPDVDHIGDAKDLSQFEDKTFDELYASHVVEHFDYNGPLQETFKEWYRVLKPGGKLHVSVPDMNVLCQLFIKRKELSVQHRFHIMRMMFGGHVDPYDYHYVGLDFDILASFLKEAKFRDCKRVDTFNIFDDTSNLQFSGVPISLNVIAYK